jgi:plastocyanin
MRRTATAALVMVVIALGTAACGGGEDRPGSGSASGSVSGSVSGTGSASGSTTGDAPFEEADADTVVHASAKDFAFEGIPASVQGPKVYFELENKGPSEHELEVLKPDGEPAGEIPAMAAGKEGSLAVELVPGEYTVQCIVEVGDKTHAELGMTQKLTVS